MAKGEAYTTLEIKLNLVRPITTDTGPVPAEGRIMHRGRTAATAEGTGATKPASCTPTPRRRAWSFRRSPVAA